MPTGAPTTQRQAVPVRHRPNIAEMTDPQIGVLRDALKALLDRGDDRGYQFWASLHGLPLPMYCHIAHGEPAFLPWHRAYLYRFERALRDTGYDAMLPWWDWTTERDVPAAYGEPTRPDGSPNPLYSVRINDAALREGLEGKGNERSRELAKVPDTYREPNLAGTHLPTAREVARLLEYPDFQRFTGNLDDFHGNVHVWTGGHMTNVPFAAYDPLFWAHHCMIDRLWRIWQLKWPQSSFPAEVRGQVMEPFNLTAEMVLDPTALGYDYSLSIAQVRP